MPPANSARCQQLLTILAKYASRQTLPSILRGPAFHSLYHKSKAPPLNLSLQYDALRAPHLFPCPSNKKLCCQN